MLPQIPQHLEFKIIHVEVIPSNDKLGLNNSWNLTKHDLSFTRAIISTSGRSLIRPENRERVEWPKQSRAVHLSLSPCSCCELHVSHALQDHYSNLSKGQWFSKRPLYEFESGLEIEARQEASTGIDIKSLTCKLLRCSGQVDLSKLFGYFLKCQINVWNFSII